MSERFYVNLPLTIGPFSLDGPEAHHLATVCRLRPGAEVCLFNGDGREYAARITHAAKRQINLEIERIDEPQRELPFTLEVAAPLPKGDRSQFMLEKLTELGVTRFVPLQCHYSHTHPRESKRDKLERYVIEASKQCGRNVLMRVGEMVDWVEYCQQGDAEELRILAHPYQAQVFHEVMLPAPMVRLAVGPEGGFIEDELNVAIANGWQTISLGSRILRVETAAITLAVGTLVYSSRSA
jgi:16S rRNA (uracil1498-N3)-methyltransferase